MKCSVCSSDIQKPNDVGTGYATTNDGAIVCYACCGAIDRKAMIDTGKATLYLTVLPHDSLGNVAQTGKLTNWPGTLSFPLFGRIKVGRHNIAGKRYDVRFTGPDGKEWHGVQYGDGTQLCHCKRVK